MKIAVVYVHPNLGSEHYLRLAMRFLETYCDHPPGLEHESIVVCNGNPPEDHLQYLFSSLPDLKLLHHDNSGYDCGAYQRASRENPADLMVFFGASAYLKREGWLRRMVQAWEQHGDGLYGCMGNRGHLAVGVHPHIRTTGFWMSSGLFNAYPHVISRPEQRYGFEHGPHSLTAWTYSQGKRVMVVGWSGCYEQGRWDAIPNGFHRGDQSDLLSGDRNSEPPFHPVP